jgi:hypothetical protein
VRKKLKNWKNRTEKKPIKPIKILKNPAGSVLGFISKKPNRNRKNQKKPSQTGKNRVKLVWTGFCPKNQTEPKPVGLTRFRFFLIRFGYFFYKNQTKLKMITPNIYIYRERERFIIFILWIIFKISLFKKCAVSKGFEQEKGIDI